MKRCPRCKEIKSPSDFNRSSRNASGLSDYCKLCVREQVRAWRERDPDRTRRLRRESAARNRSKQTAYHREYRKKNEDELRAYYREWHLKRKYGLTLEAWNALFASQGHKCAVCRTAEPGGRFGWHTDHCHDKGHVRGILCHHCNLAVGHVKDDPEIALELFAYLGGKLARAI